MKLSPVELQNSKPPQSTKDVQCWDLPVSVDKRNMEIVQIGDFKSLESSQKSICKLMKKVKIKGPGRPKRKMHAECPFDIGKSRWLFKYTKNENFGRRKISYQIKS